MEGVSRTDESIESEASTRAPPLAAPLFAVGSKARRREMARGVSNTALLPSLVLTILSSSMAASLAVSRTWGAAWVRDGSRDLRRD